MWQWPAAGIAAETHTETLERHLLKISIVLQILQSLKHSGAYSLFVFSLIMKRNLAIQRVTLMGSKSIGGPMA